MLAIEVDGGVHEHPAVSVIDQRRQKRIETFGVHFLRFKNKEIKKDMNTVIDEIEQWIKFNG